MMHRVFAFLMAGLLMAACTNPDDLDKGPVYLGDFALGHNVVVAPNLTKGPASRDASKEEWIEAMKSAVDERFGPQEGDKLYHLGISVEGYVLAVTGIPLVAAPKSVLILKVTVWDDAAGKKLNEKPEQITVIESISANTMLGSGLTQTKDVQMTTLSRNAAKLIQNWMVRENTKNEWFGGNDARPTRAEVAANAEDAETPEAAEAVETLETTETPGGPETSDVTGTPQAVETPATTSLEDGADTALTPAEQAAAITEVVVEPEVALAPDG